MNDYKSECTQISHPIPDEPAFLVENSKHRTSSGNILIIADLHIGIEHALAQAGAHVPSQTESIVQKITKLCTNHKIHRLIILGDIKHTVPGTSRQEWLELPEVFDRLAAGIERIDIIPGNHDGGLRKILSKQEMGSQSKLNFHPNTGCVLTDLSLGLFHGHTWPTHEVLQADQILFAHNHPHILFVDNIGGRASFPCWVRCRLNKAKTYERYPILEQRSSDPELIVMPAFNTLGSGTAVNSPKPEFLGPMLKNQMIDTANSEIYLLDGTDLGKLKDLIEPNFDKLPKRTKVKYKRFGQPKNGHRKIYKYQNRR